LLDWPVEPRIVPNLQSFGTDCILENEVEVILHQVCIPKTFYDEEGVEGLIDLKLKNCVD
jgi:hypothetical protein